MKHLNKKSSAQPIKSAAPPKDPLAELTEKSVAELEAEWHEKQRKNIRKE